MKRTRNSIFETNSSSTHSLVISDTCDNYLPFGDTLKIRFFSEETTLSTLSDKVSYLVSHIISWYCYDAENYNDLIDQVKEDTDFKRIESYVQEHFGKRIVFPSSYEGDLDDIVEINHQLRSWNHSLNEILEELYQQDIDYLAEVLANGKVIKFGRD